MHSNPVNKYKWHLIHHFVNQYATVKLIKKMHSSTGSIIIILIMTLATMVITAAQIQLNKSGDKAYGIVKSNEMIMYYVYTDTSFTLSLNYVDSVTVYIRSGYEPTRIMYDYIITSAYPSQDVLVYSNSTYFIGVSTTATQKSYTIELKKSNSNSPSTESGLANWIIAVIATIVSVVVLCIVGITFLIIGLICCGVFGCGLVCCGIGGAAAMHANSTQQPASSTTTVTTTYGGVNGQPMQPQQQLYYQPQKPPCSDIPMQPMGYSSGCTTKSNQLNAFDEFVGGISNFVKLWIFKSSSTL